MMISSFFTAIKIKTLLRDKKKTSIKTPPGDKNFEYYPIKSLKTLLRDKKKL